MTYIWPTGRRVELLIQFALKHSLRFISFQLFCYFAITVLFATLPLSLSLSLILSSFSSSLFIKRLVAAMLYVVYFLRHRRCQNVYSC